MKIEDIVIDQRLMYVCSDESLGCRPCTNPVNRTA